MSTVKAKQRRLTPEAWQQAAECLRILAHPQRLRIVHLLLSKKRYSVSDLAAECETSQPQMSEHLRLMQRCRFLTAVREGRTVYYEVTEPHLAQIIACIESRFGNAH